MPPVAVRQREKIRAKQFVVITDDPELEQTVSRALARNACKICFKKGAKLQEEYAESGVVVLDAGHAVPEALDAMSAFKHRHPATKVVLVVPSDEMFYWIDSIHLGASECFPKPVLEADLRGALLHAAERFNH